MSPSDGAAAPADLGVDRANIAVGNTHPRVTEGDLNANIVGEYYFTAHDGVAGAQAIAAALEHGLKVIDGAVPEVPLPVVVVKAHPCLHLMTLCVLITRNGFMVVGHSAPASPENFNAGLGRKFARENAVRQLWPLMGYALREHLHATQERTPIYPSLAAAVVEGDGRTCGLGQSVPLAHGHGCENLGQYEQQRADDDGMARQQS